MAAYIRGKYCGDRKCNLELMARGLERKPSRPVPRRVILRKLGTSWDSDVLHSKADSSSRSNIYGYGRTQYVVQAERMPISPGSGGTHL